MNEESIFAAAIAKKKPQERAAYLDEACQGNAELRAQVEELLTASAAAGSFFEHPPAALDATVDAAAHDTHKPAGWDGSLAFLTPTSKPGRIGQLAQYEIIEVVGSGGMGIVLRAFDTKLSRIVAVKVLAPELARNPTAVKRFLREAKAAAAVVHDHVVTIHNVEETHQPPFLVMQFIDGQTLQQKIDREGALDLKEILRIGCQTAAGLAAAHKHGVIHRDVKPANILLENGIERVKITDFGLARAADDVEITQTGLIAGTPQYMSPEQARGESMDARGDLFSLGSVLYTMCTGRPAFRADTTMGVIRRVCDDEPRPIREVNAEIPQWLEGIVSKLLAKNPADRLQSAAEVGELLGQHLAHEQNPASVARPATVFLPTPAKPTPSRSRISRDLITFMFVMVFSVVVVLPLLLVTLSLLSRLFHGMGRQPETAPSHPGPAVGDVQPYQGKQTDSAASQSDRTIAAAADWPMTAEKLHAAAAGPGGWTPLFNGRDLDGWSKPPVEDGNRNVVDGFPREDGGWNVVDGVLVGQGTYSYLVSQRRDYRDFLLRAEVRINEGGNSGLYFRAELPADWKSHGCVGYEAEINSTDAGGKTGSLRRYPQSPVLQQVDDTLVPAGEWFTYEVLAVGNRIATFVNGKLAASAIDDTHAQGRIALQLIREKTTVVEFRKIEIKEQLPEPGWDSLFNGQDLAGWQPHPKSSTAWTVKDNLLVGRGNNQYLYSARGDYQDFSLRAEVKINAQGDGGILVRMAPPTDKPVAESGYEVQLAGDPAHVSPTASIIRHGTKVGGQLVKGRGDMIGAGEWFVLELTAIGGKMTVAIDGQQVASYLDPQPRTGGHIALQSFSEGTEVSFRKIEIQELPAGSAQNAGPMAGDPVGGTKVADWTPLFDGTSLIGWKTHSDQPGDWKVENGLLVGSGRVSHLFSERGNYQNFHLRFEARLNAGGDSGVLVRSPFAIQPGAKGPLGYEAQIASKTGTLLEGKNVYGDPTGIEPGTWFKGEVIAADKQIIVRINGQTTANFEDPNRRYSSGHIALQVSTPQTVVQFRKIEIKELPSGATPAESSSSAADGSSAGAAPPLAVAPFDAAQAKIHQDAWASRLGAPVEITNSLGMKLRLVPPGQFTMGSTAEEQQSALANMEQTMRRADRGDERGRVAYVESIRALVASEGPAHRVTLTQPFYMGVTEVTAAQFETFVKATNHVTSAERSEKGGIVWGRVGHESSKEFQWRNPGRLPRTPDHPVTQVSYNDAVAFCKWLSETEGRTYRLPTEAQWEFACRGGTQTPWSFGSDPAEIEKYSWAEVKVDPTIKEFEFHKVGQKLTNAFGLGDMHGNVQEWCRDWFSQTTYSVRAEIDPAGAADPDDEQTRVVRGGAIFLPYDLRSAIRRRANVEYAENGLGFRVVLVDVLKPPGVAAGGSALIWGQVKDGCQVGVGFKDGKLRYKAGEPVEFEFKVRNTTDAEKTIEIDKPEEAEVWYAGDGELSVKLLGRLKEQVTLKPREEKVIVITPNPGGESIAIFPREPSAAAATNPQVKTDGLTTGFYRVSFTTYMSGAKQELSAPNFGFHFDDGGAPPAWTKGRTPAEGPPNNPELKNVVWGDPVLGLSVGIGPPAQASEPEDGIRIVYLWNTTDAPIDVQHLSHRLQDWQLVARDAKGNEFRSLGILTGPKMLTRTRLEPGQVVTPGSLTINCNWTTAERAPRGKLAAGSYKLTTAFDCRRVDHSHFNLRITSGEASVEIE